MALKGAERHRSEERFGQFPHAGSRLGQARHFTKKGLRSRFEMARPRVSVARSSIPATRQEEVAS